MSFVSVITVNAVLIISSDLYSLRTADVFPVVPPKIISIALTSISKSFNLYFPLLTKYSNKHNPVLSVKITLIASSILSL